MRIPAALVILLIFAACISTPAQEIKPIERLSQLDSIKNEAKGSVLLINFWASWCKPCVKEFPDLVKLYNDYKDKGFRLLFISLDDIPDIDKAVKPFLAQQKVDFTTYYNKLAKPEEVMDYIDKNWQGAIPSTYIYDKEGNVKKSYLGNKSYEEFEAEIKKYM